MRETLHISVKPADIKNLNLGDKVIVTTEGTIRSLSLPPKLSPKEKADNAKFDITPMDQADLRVEVNSTKVKSGDNIFTQIAEDK